MEKLRTESGAKAQQRTDNEDRTIAYRQKKRTLAANLCCIDVDQIEMRFVDGVPKAVAVLELTRTDEHAGDKYLLHCVQRFTERDAQAAMIRLVASSLGVHAWVVLFRADLEYFWLYNLTEMRGWWHMRSWEVYALWLAKGCPRMVKDPIEAQLEDVGRHLGVTYAD